MSRLIITSSLSLCLWCLSCSGAQSPGDEATDETEDGADEDESSYGDAVEPVTLERVRTGLRNQGCARVEVLESAELADPEGMVVVMTAELCEGYLDLGPAAFLVSAVGKEYIQSNTLHPLPDLHGEHAEQVEVLSLRAPRVSDNTIFFRNQIHDFAV